MKKVLFIILSIILLNPGCYCKKESDAPGLPAATQIGANTLGFYLNGEAWVPSKGFLGRPNLNWYYDPYYAGGNLSISAHRYLSDTDMQYFHIGAGNIVGTGTYPITNSNDVGVLYSSLLDSCEIYSTDSDVYSSGALIITKFDIINGIISGTFYETLYDPSCNDTLLFTSGRFDLGN